MLLVRGNDKKDPDAYRLADGSLDLARIRNDFADGYTIVLDNVERYVRTIGSEPHEMGRQEVVDTAGLPSPTGLLLEVGDVLYLPRGRVHRAETGSESSLHLTSEFTRPPCLR